MSLKPREAGKLACAGLAALAVLGTAASSAQAATLTQNYQCKYPLIGVQPLTVAIDAAIPSSWEAGEPTDAFVINAVATAGGSTAGAMQLIGAQTLEGTAKAAAAITLPSGTRLPLNVPVGIANWTKSGDSVPNPLVLNAQGSTPSLTFDDLGTASVAVNNINLNLTARNAAGQAIPLRPVTTDVDGKPVTPSDSDPGTFDAPCKLVAGQSTSLATFSITPNGAQSSDSQAPSAPSNLRGTATATSTSLAWNASSDNVGVTSYEVSRGGAVVATVSKPSVTVPATPSSSSSYSVVAVDAAGNRSSASGAVSVGNPAEFVLTTALAKYAAGIAGTATMKTLITGNLPLEGSIAADMTVLDGKITADLNLLPRTGRLSALGFLPVTARVGFSNSGKTVGDLSPEGVLTTTTKLRIKLYDVKLFGALNIAGGNNCQTKQLSTIVLRSAPNFDPVAGGNITGSFAISDLNDCGFLTGIVSPLTAGSGNRINIKLTPRI